MSEGEEIAAVFVKNILTDDIMVYIVEYTEYTDKRAEFNKRRYARRVLFLMKVRMRLHGNVMLQIQFIHVLIGKGTLWW